MNAWMVALAGLAHLGLVAVGVQVPRVFGWKEDLAKLRPANRRLFWTYGIFIALANVGFGAVSLACPAEIAAGKGAAGAFALMIGLYWLARLAAQYVAFDTPDWPAEARHPWAKHGLGILFLLLSLVYGGAFVRGCLS